MQLFLIALCCPKFENFCNSCSLYICILWFLFGKSRFAEFYS